MREFDPAEYIGKTYYFRGKVISYFAGMEAVIEMMIAKYYFGTGSSGDFKSIVLDRLTFEAKRDALRTIRLREAQSKENFKRTNTKKHPDGDLFEEIRKLNVERIRFAHYSTVVPSDNVEYVIMLSEERDGYTLHSYTEEDIDKICQRTLDVNIKLLGL